MPEVLQIIFKLLFTGTDRIYFNCEEYVNKCLKCRMQKIHKKKVFKFIRSKRHMRKIK